MLRTFDHIHMEKARYSISINISIIIINIIIIIFFFFFFFFFFLLSSPFPSPPAAAVRYARRRLGTSQCLFFRWNTIELEIAFDLFDRFFSSSLPLSVESIFLPLAVKVNYLENSTQLQRPYLKLLFSAVS